MELQKKISYRLKLLSLYFFLFISSSNLFGQCIPDTSINAPNEYGFIFPDSLSFDVNIPFDQSITLIAPTKATSGSMTFNISMLVLRSVNNKPLWLEDTCNGMYVQTGTSNPTYGYKLIGGQKYCLLLSGTPDSSSFGCDSLSLMVDAYTDINSIPILLVENTQWKKIIYNQPGQATNIYKNSNYFNEISISPNPVEAELIIKMQNIKQYHHLEIQNIFGQNLYRSIIDQKMIINMSNFTNGIYFIKFQSEQNEIIKKIVKQ